MKKIFIIFAIIGIGIFGVKYLIGTTYLDKTLDGSEIKLLDKESNAELLKDQLAQKVKSKMTLSELEEWKKENENKIIRDKKIQEVKKEIEEIRNKDLSKEDIDIESKKIKDTILSRRDRYAKEGLIQEGDTYLENKQSILALRSYQKAIKVAPGDSEIIKKLGDTYFSLYKYDVAYKYYKDIIGTPENDIDKTILSYIYSLDFNDNLNISNIFKEIESNKLNADDDFFYKTSIECVVDRKECLKSFEKYIKSGKGRKNVKIQYVKKSLENAKNLQIKEEYFIQTQLMAALFQAKIYPVVNILGDKILIKKKGYLPVLKMIAKGYYETGKYKKAKSYLKEYNKIDGKDVNVNYLLGVINIKLHEYILSNVYFNRALKLGYKPKANISRRLIYNFYLVEDNKKMMSQFKDLIENTDNINETDYSLAIYYSLINGKNIQANNWINKALKLYPKNDNFYGYKGWVYKEAKEYENAERYLLKGFELNKHNPLINLNLGIVNMNKNNILKAKIYLKNTIKEDSNGDFGKLASEYLAKIKLEQEKEKELLEQKIKLMEVEGENF